MSILIPSLLASQIPLTNIPSQVAGFRTNGFPPLHAMRAVATFAPKTSTLTTCTLACIVLDQIVRERIRGLHK